jgi:hypothetical protein
MTVSPASINGNAHALVEIAGLLQAGRPDEEISTRAVEPAVGPGVGGPVREFSRYARDQYQDAVALLAALSTRVAEVAATYAGATAHVTGLIDEFLGQSTYTPPVSSPGPPPAGATDTPPAAVR